MKPEQAQVVAEKLFGPGSKCVREGSWCRILDPAGLEVGKGESWKSALQMAAQPILAREAAAQKARQAEFERERNAFGEFLERLYIAWKEGELEFRNVKTGEVLFDPASAKVASPGPELPTPVQSELALNSPGPVSPQHPLVIL